MATIHDEWHLAAAKVSPLIWEVQKSRQWNVATAAKRLESIRSLREMSDYLGILCSEPELESLRDRLGIFPVNHKSESSDHSFFLLERERELEVYDLNGDLVFRGALHPQQQADFIRWCAGFYFRIVGVGPPYSGP